MENEMKNVKAEDVTPTWEGILEWYLTVYKDGNAEGQKTAKQELKRCAQAADRCNKILKVLPALLEAIDYAVAPYLESDEYDEDHWSRELEKAKNNFTKLL